MYHMNPKEDKDTTNNHSESHMNTQAVGQSLLGGIQGKSPLFPPTPLLIDTSVSILFTSLVPVADRTLIPVQKSNHYSRTCRAHPPAGLAAWSRVDTPSGTVPCSNGT